MTDDPAAFYDALAPVYHLLFDVDDWWTAAERHGDVAERVLRRFGVDPPARVHDVTCGIGTQAIPLAARGYEVVGTDLSAGAIERARHEAAARGVDITFDVCDVRDVGRSGAAPVAAAISFDNALAHLEEPGALVDALRAVRSTLAPGGLFAASVRDYDRLRAERPTGVTPALRNHADGRTIVGQAWEWADDGDALTVHLFLLRQRGGSWATDVFTTRSRALTRQQLSDAFDEAGYSAVAWIEPEDVGYYQPIVVAKKP